METFAANVPTGWSINEEELAEKDTAQGNVHAGQSSVRLYDGAVLTQDIALYGGCYYAFSFFARGNGAQVQLEATVTFLSEQALATNAATILIRMQDLPNDNREFGYYRTITTLAPENALAARISFTVTANSEQSMNLDDVSFSVA